MFASLSDSVVDTVHAAPSSSTKRFDQNKYINITLDKLVQTHDDSHASLLIRRICNTVVIAVQSSVDYGFESYDIGHTIQHIKTRSEESPYVSVVLGHLYTDVKPIKNIDEACYWYMHAAQMCDQTQFCSPWIYNLNGLLYMEKTCKNCTCENCIDACGKALTYFNKTIVV